MLANGCHIYMSSLGATLAVICVGIHLTNVCPIFTVLLPLVGSPLEIFGSLAAKCSTMFTSHKQWLSAAAVN